MGETSTVTVTIHNTGRTDALNVRLRNTLAEGLVYTPIEDPTPDPEAGGLSLLAPVVAPESESGDLVAVVDSLPAGESVTLTYRVVAEAAPSGDADALTDVLQVSAEGLAQPLVADFTLVVLAEGLRWGAIRAGEARQVTSPRVTLDVPADAFAGDEALVVVRPGSEVARAAREQELLVRFDLLALVDPGPGWTSLPAAARAALEAADPRGATDDPERPDVALSATLDSRRPMEEAGLAFELPYTMTVSFEGLADLDGLWMDRQPFVAVWDPETGIWVRQPVESIDRDRNTVTLQASHFSTWGAGIGGAFPDNGASIPLYDEARVSPFTGRATYTYPLWAPAGRRGMAPSLALSYASGMVDGILGDVQSSWVGMGWSIDSVGITRQILNGGCGASCGSGVYGYENEFVLTFNSTGYRLIADPTTAGRYHTEEESFLYIQLHNADLGNEQDGGVSPPNTSSEWWEIAAADGARYRLGWNADSEQLAPMPGYTPSLPGAWADLGYAGEANNRVTMRWRVDLVEDLYGNTITYTYDEETRTVAGTSDSYDRASYLDTIRYTGGGGDACDPASESCYEVRFERSARQTGEDLPDSGDLNDWDTWDSDYLDRIEVYAMDSGGDTLLRTYTLELSEVNRQDGDGDTWTWDSLVLDEIVISAGSLTAPRISFTYTNFDNRASVVGEPEWAYPRLTAVENGAEGVVTFTYGNDGRPASQYFAWRVIWREASDGVTADEMRTEYTYGPACYNDASDEENGWCNAANEGALVGHGYTVMTVRDFDGSSISTVRYDFHTEEARVGRIWRADTRDSDGTVYFRTETDYTTVDSTVNTSYPEGVRFTYADEARSYERQGAALALVTRSTYSCDSDWGDLTADYTYDGDGALLTRSAYTYLRNDTLHLHGFIRSAIAYDSQDIVLSAAYYAYDDTADSLGSLGELTLLQTRTLADATQTIDATYDYDAYGNQTEARTHGGYGTLGAVPTDSSTLDRWTTTTYDTTYHTYPVAVENVLGQVVATAYDFELSELPLGLPRQVTDPNGATTTTVYDALGRVTETWQPGAAQASLRTIYPALNASGELDAPYTIELQIWDDGGPGGAQYRSAWAFYDGLGRLIRTVGPAEDAGRYIRTDTGYGPLGKVERSARPYEVTLASPPGSWTAPNWAALAYTQMLYDGFGRVAEVIAPDGATVVTRYDGRTTVVIDANGHKTASTVDDFGRLAAVSEYTGTGTSGDPYTLYATTTYAYDARGLLTGVEDALDKQTTIAYDGLGRKVSMSDPDMGTWAYTYTLFGELYTQTDARGAQLRFTYDGLGRVTGREARMVSTDPWMTVAAYTYDDATGGNKGIGRLTGAASAWVSGSPTVLDSFTYDRLGWVTGTTRTVDGVDYTTLTTYDSLGRVLSSTLPTGETVHTTYNARGLFEGLYGTGAYSGSYVSSTNYTPTGAVGEQTLGSGVVARFSYDPGSDRLSRLTSGRPTYAPLLDLSYEYDDAGNVTQIEDGVRDETRGYAYDHLDRLTFASVYAGPQFIEERWYTYDALGNLLSFRLNYPSTLIASGAFAPGGFLEGASYAGRASLNPAGAEGLGGMTYRGEAAGVFITGPGASSGELPGSVQAAGTVSGGAGMLAGAAYHGRGNIDPFGSFSGMTPYVYGEGLGAQSPREPYMGPTGSTQVDYTYGEGGTGPHAVTSLSDGSTFTYDANGNMISLYDAPTGATWTYAFDAENRLVSASDGTTTTTYVYDGEGRRVRRVVEDGVTVTATLYVMGMEIELVGGVEDHRTLYYGAGGAFRVIGGENAGLYFRHTDHLGSTSVISDSGGLLVEGSDVAYAPFGEVRAGNLSELTDFGFTGQRLDRSTGGLMYYNARYYLPELRRFISPDTIVPGAGNPQNLNRYSYVRNNPVNYVDPSGHAPVVGTDPMEVWRPIPRPFTPRPVTPEPSNPAALIGGGVVEGTAPDSAIPTASNLTVPSANQSLLDVGISTPLEKEHSDSNTCIGPYLAGECPDLFGIRVDLTSGILPIFNDWSINVVSMAGLWRPHVFISPGFESSPKFELTVGPIFGWNIDTAAAYSGASIGGQATFPIPFTTRWGMELEVITQAPGFYDDPTVYDYILDPLGMPNSVEPYFPILISDSPTIVFVGLGAMRGMSGEFVFGITPNLPGLIQYWRGEE